MEAPGERERERGLERLSLTAGVEPHTARLPGSYGNITDRTGSALTSIAELKGIFRRLTIWRKVKAVRMLVYLY